MDGRYNPSYTFGMKTAVSIPDPIFKAAERAAKRAKISRSQLYTVALRELLNSKRDQAILEALNKVYSKEDSSLPPDLERAAYDLLSRVEW